MSMLTAFTSSALNPTNARRSSAQIRLASPRSQSHLSSSEPGTQVDDFSQISQNSPRTLPVNDVIHIPWSPFYLGFFILTSVNDTSSSRTHQNMRSSLHLTNPCTEPKSSQPN